MAAKLLVFSILISLSIICTSDDTNCVYTVYVRTGSIIKAGTASTISLTLSDAGGNGIRIPNLQTWGGLMGSGYNYFERGNLDIFSGRGPCLTGPVCAMNLTSDGKSGGHGWYVSYVEVSTTGVHTQCAQKLFTVERWLAKHIPPFNLTAVSDDCTVAKKNAVGGSGSVLVSVL